MAYPVAKIRCPSTSTPLPSPHSRPWDQPLKKEFGSTKQKFLPGQLKWKTLLSPNSEERDSWTWRQVWTTKQGVLITWGWEQSRNTHARVSRFERDRKESPSHTCPGPCPKLMKQIKDSSILGQKTVIEREKVGSSLLRTWDHWKIALPTVRGNRKKGSLIMYTQFLTSFKLEDAELATESCLRSPGPNPVFHHPHCYMQMYTAFLQIWSGICFHYQLYQQPSPHEPSFCFSCLLQETLHSGSFRWNLTTFVVIVKDHLIFRGHMPYVLKEDDKYCFVTFSWQNAKWSENKDTFHTWSFKKILGKILKT